MAVGTPGSTPRGIAPLHHRKNIELMTADQVKRFRKSIEASQALNDDRGFQWWAGIHGLPLPISCEHGTDLFLPWHRAYLYFFELSLQDRVATVSLPWWNWTGKASHASGIPARYLDRDVKSGANPLASVRINGLARQQFATQSGTSAPGKTRRQPGDPTRLPTVDQVNAVLGLSDFLDFSQQLEEIHNAVHVWVGGTMSEIPLAAYDPIFFAHHSMIDRIWRLWQLRHTGSKPPDSLMREALPPFRITVEQTLSVTALGYDYASSTQTASPQGA